MGPLWKTLDGTRPTTNLQATLALVRTVDVILRETNVTVARLLPLLTTARIQAKWLAHSTSCLWAGAKRIRWLRDRERLWELPLPGLSEQRQRVPFAIV